MFKKQKHLGFLSIFSLALGSLSIISCSNNNKKNNFSVVTTIFPQYDWVKNVVSDTPNFDIDFLVNNGIDLHSYQPSVKDIANISTCDLFIYTGGESDEWVEDALKNAKNKNLKAINLLEVLGEKVKEEEAVEGMEEEEESEEEEEIEYDEHVWLSLRNASIIVDEIANVLSQIDPNNSAKFNENALEYKRKLNELDEKYTEAVALKNKDTILFGDRFPFRYLVDDYGLNYYAAFLGCSAETEASFQTIAFLANKVDELNLNVILTLEGNNNSIAETIKNNTRDKNQKIMSMNSLQSIKSSDAKNGVSYLNVMERNLDTLKEAIK